VFRHIIRFDHKRRVAGNLITQPFKRLTFSFRPLVCTLDDTSIAEAKPSKAKIRRGTGNELERSALRVNQMDRKSKNKSERGENRKNVTMRSGGNSQ
jgi:hypothetical protein